MTQGIFENQVITQTLEAQENLLTGGAIGTFQAGFLLCEADFLRLKSEGSQMANWSLNILFATIGYGMSILPKWISEISGKPEKVSQSEWTALAILIGITVLLFVVAKFMPNERKVVLNQIDEHFKTAPRTRQFVRGAK